MTLKWTGSATKETWKVPLEPGEDAGSCTMEGVEYKVNAVRE